MLAVCLCHKRENPGVRRRSIVLSWLFPGRARSIREQWNA
jgi:hypothetical protein